MTTRSTVRRIVLSLSASAILYGCASAPSTKTESQNNAAPAALPSPPPIFSVNELMVMVVDRPGELMWDIEKPGHTPKTDEEWYQLENNAIDVAAAGTLIQLGGTGPADMGWATKPDWRKHAEKLISVSLVARDAAKRRDLKALIQANGDLVDACLACHAEFKPDLPTAGIFIHKRPEKK